MTNLTPAQMLKYTTDMADRLDAIKKRAVFVGLPKDKVGGAVYGNGMTVIQIGAIHEFGAPEQGIPQRSFLRVPFATKQTEVNKAIALQMEAITSGRRPADVGLGRVGVIATNISKGAFVSLGYGAWKPSKKVGQTLVDTGILRSSINWVVRNAS